MCVAAENITTHNQNLYKKENDILKSDKKHGKNEYEVSKTFKNEVNKNKKKNKQAGAELCQAKHSLS